jgi:hypothetical protein
MGNIAFLIRDEDIERFELSDDDVGSWGAILDGTFIGTFDSKSEANDVLRGVGDVEELSWGNDLQSDDGDDFCDDQYYTGLSEYSSEEWDAYNAEDDNE